MATEKEIRLVQNYVNFLGKFYIILLSTLDRHCDRPLSINEKIILQILDEEPIPMKEIAGRTGLAMSTLTSIIDKMEKKKLVIRRYPRSDRRMVKIELDSAGLDLKIAFNQLIYQLSATMLKMLPAREAKKFTSGLSKTLEVMSAPGAENQTPMIEALIEPFTLTLIRQFKE